MSGDVIAWIFIVLSVVVLVGFVTSQRWEDRRRKDRDIRRLQTRGLFDRAVMPPREEGGGERDGSDL